MEILNYLSSVWKSHAVLTLLHQLRLSWLVGYSAEDIRQYRAERTARAAARRQQRYGVA